MSYKWQDNHMVLFLKAYQRYECLWNTKCTEYGKSSVREKAYSSMVIDLNLPGLTVADIKAKIKTIRTRYAAEVSKIRSSERSGGSVDEVYEPRLFWFKDADVFLRNICTPKPSSSNSKGSQSTCKDPSGKATNASQCLEQSEQQTADVQDTERSSPDNNLNYLAVRASSPKSTAYLQNCRKGRKRSLNACVSGLHDAIKQLKKISEESKQDLNEFDLFCESLALQLKKMPLNRALICQEKLQNVMTQERLFQLTHSQYRQSTSSRSSSYQHSLPTHNSDQYSTM